MHSGELKLLFRLSEELQKRFYRANVVSDVELIVGIIALAEGAIMKIRNPDLLWIPLVAAGAIAVARSFHWSSKAHHILLGLKD